MVEIQEESKQEQPTRTTAARPALRLDPAKVAQKAREIAEIIEDGEGFIGQAIGQEAMAEIERRTEVFDTLARDFDWQLGKVSSTILCSRDVAKSI